MVGGHYKFLKERWSKVRAIPIMDVIQLSPKVKLKRLIKSNYSSFRTYLLHFNFLFEQIFKYYCLDFNTSCFPEFEDPLLFYLQGRKSEAKPSQVRVEGQTARRVFEKTQSRIKKVGTF